MIVSLTPELEQYIRRKVDSGLYSNASEVVCEALRLLVGRDAPHLAQRGAIRQADARRDCVVIMIPLPLPH